MSDFRKVLREELELALAGRQSDSKEKGGQRFEVQQGDQTTIALPTGGPWPKKYPLLRSDREWKHAVAWSITLDKLGSGLDWIADTPGAVAYVRWGVGGATHEAYVDWRRGTRFTLFAATVEIDVMLLNPSDWGSGLALANLRGWPCTFRASMVPTASAVPHGCPPTMTVAVPTVVGEEGESDYITIPPFARRMLARGYNNFGNAPNYQVYWYTGFPGTVGPFVCREVVLAVNTFDRQHGSHAENGIWEVPMEATMVRLQNMNAGGDWTYPRAIFELAL